MFIPSRKTTAWPCPGPSKIGKSSGKLLPFVVGGRGGLVFCSESAFASLKWSGGTRPEWRRLKHTRGNKKHPTQVHEGIYIYEGKNGPP